MTDEELSGAAPAAPRRPGVHRRHPRRPRPRRGPGHPLRRPGVHAPGCSLVASGKGGVGKSSVTVNLAVALAQRGQARGRGRRRRLGVLHPADARHRPAADRHRRQMILPPVAHGVACVSIGFFVRRGPAGDLAGPDAAQGPRAVPHRLLLGRARLPRGRHAAGHRRHRPVAGRSSCPAPRPTSSPRPSPRPSGWPSGPGSCSAPHQHPGAGRHREHELVHRRRRQALRAVRRRRRRRCWPTPRGAAARPGAAGARAARRAATRAGPSWSPTPTARRPGVRTRWPSGSTTTSPPSAATTPSSPSASAGRLCRLALLPIEGDIGGPSGNKRSAPVGRQVRCGTGPGRASRGTAGGSPRPARRSTRR